MTVTADNTVQTNNTITETSCKHRLNSFMNISTPNDSDAINDIDGHDIEDDVAVVGIIIRMMILITLLILLMMTITTSCIASVLCLSAPVSNWT